VAFVQQWIYHIIKEWYKGKNQNWVNGLTETHQASNYELNIYSKITRSQKKKQKNTNSAL